MMDFIVDQSAFEGSDLFSFRISFVPYSLDLWRKRMGVTPGFVPVGFYEGFSLKCRVRKKFVNESDGSRPQQQSDELFFREICSFV